MKIVGFNFTKISAEKLSDKPEKLEIKTNIDIKEIAPIKSNIFKSKEELLGIKFAYTILYEKDYAKIDFEGAVILSVDSKQSKSITKDWKNKDLKDDFKYPLFNIILTKSNVKALQLEEEFNLPLHIPLPTLGPGKKQ
jgi:hypothetical protein